MQVDSKSSQDKQPQLNLNNVDKTQTFEYVQRIREDENQNEDNDFNQDDDIPLTESDNQNNVERAYSNENI
jgi:hypothetical protein